MSRIVTRDAAVLLVVCLAALAPVSGQAPMTVGPEFRVNSYTISYQSGAAVALDASGDFVVVWESYNQDGSHEGVFLRLFSAVGVGLATELQVNTYTVSDQSRAAVARDADGDFVVVWDSPDQDGSSYGVFARRFNSSGSPQAVEFQVSTYTQGNQRFAAVASDAAGNFVVSWDSYQDGSFNGVFARRFSASGVAQAAEFQVNTFTSDRQYRSSVSMDPVGDFVVTWVSRYQDGSGAGVFARRFDAAGVPQASEFQANTYTSLDQRFPAVALDGDGDFVVTWSSKEAGADTDVLARRFNAQGAAQAAEFQVNSYTPSYQYNPAVAMKLDGGFVVTWASYNQDASNYGIFGRTFDSAGAPLAAEFRVNTYTQGSQYFPAIDVDDNGDFVVTWGTVGQDGDHSGVFAQRFGKPAVLDIDGNGQTAALTDGLLVLRFLFGFTGPTLVTGVVDLGACTRCTAGEIQTYLETLI